MYNHNLANLAQKVKLLSAKSPHRKDSDGYYQLTVDSAGNGAAVIRFLPAQQGDEFPFVQLHSHGFQGSMGKWFIENCPSTLGLRCPVCEAYSGLMSSGNEAEKKLASTRKRRMSYVSSVLIMKDPKVPSKEGHVYLFKYGVRIMDKLMDLIAPSFGDTEPLDPFDPATGANFRLRVIKTGPFPDYEKSAFDQPSVLGNEQAIEAALKQRQALREIVDPKQFKSYDELKAKFQQVIGQEAGELAGAEA